MLPKHTRLGSNRRNVTSLSSKDPTQCSKNNSGEQIKSVFFFSRSGRFLSALRSRCHPHITIYSNAAEPSIYILRSCSAAQVSKHTTRQRAHKEQSICTGAGQKRPSILRLSIFYGGGLVKSLFGVIHLTRGSRSEGFTAHRLQLISRFTQT